MCLLFAIVQFLSDHSNPDSKYKLLDLETAKKQNACHLGRSTTEASPRHGPRYRVISYT